MTHTYQQEGRWTGTLLVVSHPLAVDFPGKKPVCVSGIEKIISSRYDDLTRGVDQILELGHEESFSPRGIFLNGDNESLRRVLSPMTFDRVVLTGGAVGTYLLEAFDSVLWAAKRSGKQIFVDIITDCCYFAKNMKFDDEEWKEQAVVSENSPVWKLYNQRVFALGPGYKVGRYTSGPLRNDAQAKFLTYFKGEEDWMHARGLFKLVERQKREV